MAKKKITELSQSLLKVGDKFFFTGILNPSCEGYGLLTCTKIAFEATKFCTNPTEIGCYGGNDHYIDRPSVHIYWKDSKGKKGSTCYWLDEWNGRFGKESVKIAKDEQEVLVHHAKDRLDWLYRDLLNACRKAHGDLVSLANVTKDDADRKVLTELVCLRTALEDAKKISSKYSRF